MVGELATLGSVYSTTSESLQNTTDTIDTNRQAVIGVSSDEELTNMIKYQAAYNAASRYINVVSEMIDYLLSSL
jgi:flagellar hook-associated protein 1 FlgK